MREPIPYAIDTVRVLDKNGNIRVVKIDFSGLPFDETDIYYYGENFDFEKFMAARKGSTDFIDYDRTRVKLVA